MPQLHKKFSDSQVKELFERYSRQLIERSYIQDILGIGKARFFALLKRFRSDPEGFSIHYHRTTAPRAIDPAIEKNILNELAAEKKAYSK